MAHLLLEHLAEDFAAHVLGAGLVVRHHPARRRQDRDYEAALERLQVLDLRIHAPPRLRYTRDVTDDRLALVILQLYHQLRETHAGFVGLVAAEEHFTLQHYRETG